MIVENGKARTAYLKRYIAEWKKEFGCKCMWETHTEEGWSEMHKSVSGCEAKGESYKCNVVIDKRI